MTILIPLELVKDNSFSNYAIAVYCALHEISVPIQMKKPYVNQQQLYYLLTGEISDHRKILTYINCGLNELIDNNVIKKVYEFKKQYIVDCSNLWIDTSKTRFVPIAFDEVRAIFQIDNVNKYLLLRYYIHLMGTINSNTYVCLESGKTQNHVVGNTSLDYLCELTGLTKKTIIEYNKILEDNKLIHVFRHDDFVLDKKNSKVKSLSNVYGRYSDKEYIDHYGNNQKEYYNSYKFIKSSKTNKEELNNRRKLAQWYLQIAKGNDSKYTKSEIETVYKYVLEENEKYQNLYDIHGYSKYLEKLRDIRIFDKYDFINNED